MTDTDIDTGLDADGEGANPPEMNVSIDTLSEIERKVSVEIPWDQVKGRLDDAYRELAQGVSIKGFRKGKVPRKMLERMFGKHINKEVALRLVQDSIAKALADHDLSPVSEPKIEDNGLVDGEAFRYTATLQVVPEIEPRDYFDVAVKQRPARTTDEELDQALESKRREATEYRPVEGRATQAGDVVLVDVMGKQGDRPLSHERELIELGDPPREPLPGLAAKLTGIAADTEELEVELDLPVPGEDGKTAPARLLVTLHDLKQKIIPELDDDLAKDSGEADTLEGLKEVLRQRLLEVDEKKAHEEAKAALIDEVLKRNEVPAVPALVERHLDRTIQLQLRLLGIDPNMPGIDREALKERARTDAEQAVKSMLLLKAIAKREKVEVDEADVAKRLAEIASARGQNVARVRGEYEEEGRLETVRSSIREEKTLDLLMSRAKISTVELPEISEQTSSDPDPGQASETRGEP